MPRLLTHQDIKNIVTYHAPTDAQLEDIQNIRDVTEQMLLTIQARCPECADKSAAIRKVREAMMTANAAIVLEGFV